MIKKVSVAALRRGMYIHDLNCGWMDHPFLFSRFRVEGEEEVARIRTAGIRELYIDTQLGDDVADAPTATEVQRELDREMVKAVEAPAAHPRATTVREEYERATRVHGEANRIVRDLMQDVRLGRQVSVEKLEPVVERITESILANSGALLGLCRVKNKDDYTFAHSVAVCALLVAFSRAAGLDSRAVQEAGIGGMLHDVGKIRVPDAILNKPGRLDDEEFAVMKQHVAESICILAETPGVPAAAQQVAAEHHERFDGTGYPAGLPGSALSQMGRMAAICDVYDAITSDRVYHKGLPPTEALRKIFEWSKFHFDPALTQKFLRTIGIYPVASLVMLESGRLAVVLEQCYENLLQPRVRVIYDSRHRQFLPPQDVDLARSMGHGGADRIVGHESPERWKIDPMRFM